MGVTRNLRGPRWDFEDSTEGYPRGPCCMRKLEQVVNSRLRAFACVFKEQGSNTPQGPPRRQILRVCAQAPKSGTGHATAQLASMSSDGARPIPSYP